MRICFCGRRIVSIFKHTCVCGIDLPAFMQVKDKVEKITEEKMSETEDFTEKQKFQVKLILELGGKGVLTQEQFRLLMNATKVLPLDIGPPPPPPSESLITRVK